MGTLVEKMIGHSQRGWVRHLTFDDAGHGYDALGLSPGGVQAGLAITRPFYDLYFRVSSHGAKNIPDTGGAILAANHSGMLPIDAFMLWADVVHNTRPVRVPRIVADHFVALLPGLGTLFARAGAVAGTRGNLHHLLDRGELLAVFPEGVPGIGKGWRKRYQLEAWRPGHVELAIRHQVPIIPVAILGAEEAWAQLGKLERVHWFGAPYLPVPLTPMPLPTHMHIHYGAPIDLSVWYPPGSARHPRCLEEAAQEVKAVVQALIDDKLRERGGIFR